MRPAPEAAMVLAAGLGTRMRPLTDRVPKAMVEVGGQSLIHRALDRVAAAGAPRAVVNLHHFADALEAHIAARRAPAVVFSDERARLLDTGGGVAHALPLLGEAPFLALNADAVFAGPEPLTLLAETWRRMADDMLALMLLVPRERAWAYTRPGDFFLDADGGVPARRGGAGHAPYVFTGAQVLSPAVFDPAERVGGEAFSLNPVWDRLIAARRLRAVIYPGAWVDVGTPAGIAEAEAALAEGAAP
ncbi:MAG: nucleotidyltransferase family protein [Paracoccaceae bacterium]